MGDRKYLGYFDNWDDVVNGFRGECPKEEPRFVFAEYDCPGYEGNATVIFSADGSEFNIVEGSHCSCFGLEDQWDVTEHDEAQMMKMMEASWGFFHCNRDAIEAWLAYVKETK